MENEKKALDLSNIGILNELYNIIFSSENKVNNVLSLIKDKINENKLNRINNVKARKISNSDISEFLTKLSSLKFNYNELMLEISELVNKYNVNVKALSKKLIVESDTPEFLSEIFNVLFGIKYNMFITESITKKIHDTVYYRDLNDNLINKDIQKLLEKHRDYETHIKFFNKMIENDNYGISKEIYGDMIFTNAMTNRNLNEPEKYVCYLLSKKFGSNYNITHL